MPPITISPTAPVTTAKPATKWPRARYFYKLASSTVKYLMHTEVHTFAFSVAANAILSFFPFILLLMNLVFGCSVPRNVRGD